jgi:hypothetical protein
MVRAALLLVLLLPALSGCESEDPKIRNEMAELRVRIGELERDNSRLSSQLEEARDKAARMDFVGRETLRQNLEEDMPELRATLARAFPGLKVDPVSPGTISTPLDQDGFPYNTELSFGLSEGPGRRVTTYTINIKADREGKWRQPDLGAIAALQTLRSTGGDAPAPAGAAAAEGPRIIDWGQTGTASGPPPPSPASAAPQPPPDAAPTVLPTQPPVQAPFPVQDTRTIEFD